MSRSLSDPEYAVPAVPVRPEQAREPAQTADQNNARGAAPQRNQSSSLLSRLFSPFYQAGEAATVAVGSAEFPEPVADTGRSSPAGTEGNNLDDTYNRGTFEIQMATAMIPAKSAALVAGDTPAPTPEEFDISNIRDINSIFIGHRGLLNSRRGRGTSLERTQKEKRVQDFSNSIFSINPGDTGMINSPAPQSPIAPITSSDNPFLDGVRANYRSWRDVNPGIAAEKAWSFGEQASGEVPEGQVEKSVAEALAGIEPNSRSRKASHSLRFFREGLPEEKPKRREQKDNGRPKDKSPGMKDLVPLGVGIRDNENLKTTISRTGDDSTSSKIAKPLSTFDSVSGTGEATSTQSNATAQTGKKLNTLPAQLLDDLRKQHNLTPAPSKGFSFSRSLPVTESERDNSHVELQNGPDDEVALVAACKNKSVVKDEDEESGEEQISSAVFVPHKLSHDLPEHRVLSSEDQDRSGSLSQHSGQANSEEWLVEHEVPSRGGDEIVVGKASPHNLLEAVHDRTPEIGRDNYFPDTLQSPDAPYDTVSEAGYSTKDDESSFTDDTETTPTGRSTGSRYKTGYDKDHLHRHQQVAKAPLEAIELIPYRHQVGGHTTMWRFSKRAVCKQLNNRENEFYERIERYHPKLLKFMPRYIGVLNVTFEKQQKRKASAKENEVRPETDLVSPGLPGNNGGNSIRYATDHTKPPHDDDRHRNPLRLVSQSILEGQAPTPTVTFADNRHIIPKSFQQEAVPRYISESPAMNPIPTRRPSQSQPPLPNGDFTFRPTLSDKHAASWGATTVNKKLRNEVFGEAFLQQSSPNQRHRRQAHQPRRLVRRQGQPSSPSQLRMSNSESNLITAQQHSTKGATERGDSISLGSDGFTVPDPGLNPTHVGEQSNSNGIDNKFEEKAAMGTLTPEALVEPHQTKKKRRHSSGGLHRKSREVAEDGDDLQYFEEAEDAGYKGDGELDVFQIESEMQTGSNGPNSRDSKFDILGSDAPTEISNTSLLPLGSVPVDSTQPPPRPKSTNSTILIPRPVNPKEAQTQRDKRVEFFLLLEDLTAGMKRPCIMDLKMGTRQYGIEANEKKQKSQRRKCAETTSKDLGVRVCGLQVWDVATQSYIFQDKYFGRKLKAGREFQDALQRFLFDGVEYASVLRHIPTILQKLSELEVLIKDLRGYRFYAASLLMFYDGGVDDTDTSTAAKQIKIKKREIDFKIADFANCVTAENGLLAVKEKACPPQHPKEPDKGFLRGLKSLRKYFIEIQKEVIAFERRRSVEGSEVKNIGTNGFSSTDGSLDDDLGEVSY